MIAQQHKIMRHVLEVRGCPRDAAPRIQSELRGAHYQRLLPLIEKICSDLSAPGRIHRIDTLEIDLGAVPLHALQSAVADKFEAAFRRKLAAAISGAPEIDSELELFSYFIRTGTVPWWADRSDRGLLEASLHGLIRRVPQALRRAIQAAPDQERARRRMARAYPDRLLDELVVVMTPRSASSHPGPSSSGLGAEWVAVLGSVSRARGYPVRAARNLWWEEMLRVAGAGGVSVSEAPGFFREILTRVARRLGSDYRSLVADLRRTLDDSTLSVQPWARSITEGLWNELGGDSRKIPESASPSESVRADLMRMLAQLEPVPAPDADLWARLRAALEQKLVAPEMAEAIQARADLMRMLAQLEPVPAPDAHLWARLRAVIDRLPARLRAQALAAFEAAKGEASGGEALSGATMDALVALVHAALEQKLVAPEMADAAREPPVGAPEQDTPVDLRFSDADEVYVENAGLVILWPFLESFFARLGLTEEKRFKDEAAAHRAVGLLQYIAAADESPPEYLLPLNKVLCGIAPDEVFDFGPDITPEEIEECTDLLAAVIHQAPILREMSIPGFRGSFLLRKGQLGSRDGNWLLRVERETYDVVLDRFPWSVHLVKLPWMKAMMQVEW